jgi:hypothetical protein
MMHVYTLEINGVSVPYKKLSYSRELGLTVTELTATVKYDSSYAEAGFKTLAVKNNGVLEWFGYLEKSNPVWTENGLFLEIWGRDVTVLLWKKWNERYSDSRTQGFFGAVDPKKLIQFLLRCPVSESVVLNYDNKTSCELNKGVWDDETQTCFRSRNHKIGYGIDSTNWVCSSNRSANISSPHYVKTRLLGFSWVLGDGAPHLPLRIYDGEPPSVAEWVNVNGGYLGDNSYSSYIRGKYELTDTFNEPNRVILRETAYAGQNYLRLGIGDTSKIQLREGDVIVIAEYEPPLLLFEDSGGLFVTREEAIVHSVDTNTDTIYLKNYLTITHTVGRLVGLRLSRVFVTKRINNENNYYRFSYIRRINMYISNPSLKIVGKFITHYANGYKDGFEGDASVTLHVQMDFGDGKGWQEIGDLTWNRTENFNLAKSLDLSGFVETSGLIFSPRLRFNADIDWTANLEINEISIVYNGNSTQRANDDFLIDLGEVKDRVCGIYIECRGLNASDKFARNYAIETSLTGRIGSWTAHATKTNNICKDIIESWQPISCRYVKIRITKDSPHEWQISQIYIYQADDRKYCIWNHGSGNTLGPYLSGNFVAEDYVAKVNSSIAPLNIGYGRLIDSIQEVLNRCHEGYINWEAWVDFETLDFHFAERRGSDKSNTIRFIKGVNIGKIDKTTDQRNCVSRAKIVGKSESKISDEVSSDWVSNSTVETSLGTFYESAESIKSVSNLQTANVLANVETTLKGQAEILYEIEITNDTYYPLAYDVGDDVTITDNLTGINGAYRIIKIEKDIDGNNNELITLYVSTSLNASRYQDISNEFAKIRKQLKDIGFGINIVEDWLASGAQGNKIDSDKLTETWTKSAKNEEQFAPKNEADPAWYKTGTPSNNPVAGQDLLCYDDWFVIKGSKVINRTGLLRGYVKNDGSTTSSETGSPTIGYINNPKFSVDIKIWVDGPNPEINATTWREGDQLIIGMGNTDFTSYFGFAINKYNDEYILHMVKKRSGEPVGDSLLVVKDVNDKQIIIDENVKIKLGATVNWDNRNITYYVNGEIVGVLPLDEDYKNDLIFPVFFNFLTANGSSITNWSQAYIYKYSSEWEI